MNDCIEITCPICSNRIWVNMDCPKAVCKCGAEMVFFESVNEKYKKEIFVYVTNQPVLVRSNVLKHKK